MKLFHSLNIINITGITNLVELLVKPRISYAEMNT